MNRITVAIHRNLSLLGKSEQPSALLPSAAAGGTAAADASAAAAMYCCYVPLPTIFSLGLGLGEHALPTPIQQFQLPLRSIESQLIDLMFSLLEL
mmetsp:Transcript_13148/g.18319  ORF Transcript_13148/g.18319 Transcript_13148/m.18319 type:complete len:95 (+) Transcript_13148:75-359(+)